VLEGPDLVSAALDAGAAIEAVYVEGSDPSAIAERAADQGVRVFTLQSGVLATITDAQTPQPVIAAWRFIDAAPATLNDGGLTVIVHDLRDPGNAGTIVRSADAFGAQCVIFTGHTVDPYNPKALRATAGSIFHVPVVVGRFDETANALSNAGVVLWAAVVHGGDDPSAADLSGAVALVVGNESGGLDATTIARCDATVTIPMAGRSESLNAGVAVSLLAYEAMRQRRGAGGDRSRPSLGGL